MTIKLHYHPFSSYCQKALIAFYETGTPFEGVFVSLGDEASHSAFLKVWPIGKFPVIEQPGGRVLPESSSIIEYVAQRSPGSQLIPDDADLALQARTWDRIFDNYVSTPMQTIVAAAFRPVSERDVEDAKALLATAYGLIEPQVADRTWAVGEVFTLADCAAAPALFYASVVVPFKASHPGVWAYFQRLLARPSFARAVDDAKAYRSVFPIPGAVWPDAG